MTVLFLFKSGRHARLREKGPREFFYGFTELAAQGIAAEMVEETDLPVPPLAGKLERAATRLLSFLTGLNAACLLRLAQAPVLARLNQARVLIATTNSQGLALGALKTLGCLKTPVLFLPMGVWPLTQPGPSRFFLSLWLKPLSLAPISRAETAWLDRRLSKQADLAYLPFGIDDRFWFPSDPPSGSGYVLAIGNDPHRDWECLSKAWHPGLPPLKIVTRLAVPQSQGPVEVISGDWSSRPLSDEQVRDLFQKALFVVLPIRDTIQPSGQSACLQAMACGKAVILSSIVGLWDNEMLKDGETCLLTPPGDAAKLAETAGRLHNDPALAQRLGKAARSAVESHFTIKRMGEALAIRLRRLTTG